MHDTRQVLALEGLDFVEAAYAYALGRAADPSGLRNYLHSLHSGAPKERILGELQASEEGRAYAARRGLPVRAGAPAPVRAERRTAPPAVTLDALLALKDADFIDQAYQLLLGREADGEGSTNYLAELRQGTPRVVVLARLRDSAEGKARQARLEGLDQAVAAAESGMQGIGSAVRALSRRLRPAPAPAQAQAAKVQAPARVQRPLDAAQAASHGVQAAAPAAALNGTVGTAGSAASVGTVGPISAADPVMALDGPRPAPARAARPPAVSTAGTGLTPSLRLERFTGSFAEGYGIAGGSCALSFGGRILGQLAFDQSRPELQAVHDLPTDQLGFRVQLGGLLHFAALSPSFAGFELSPTGDGGASLGIALNAHLAQGHTFSPLKAFARLPPERTIGQLKGLSFAAGNELRLLFEATPPREDASAILLDVYQSRTEGRLERLARFAIEPMAQLSNLTLRLLSRHAPVLLVASDAQRRLLLTDCIPLPELHAEAHRALLDYHSLLAGGQASFDVAAKIARAHLDAELSERLETPTPSDAPQRGSTALLVYSRDSHDFAVDETLEAALAVCPRAGVLTCDGSVRLAGGEQQTLLDFAAAKGTRHLLLVERRCLLRPDFWAVVHNQRQRCGAATQLLHWHSIWLDGVARPYVAKTGLLLDPALGDHALLPLHAAIVAAPLLLKTLKADPAPWRSGALELEHVFASLVHHAVNCLPVVLDAIELPWTPAAEERLGAAHVAVPLPPRLPARSPRPGRPDPALSAIVNFRNGADETLRCLESLKAQAWHGALEVVLVDNASTPQDGLLISRRAQELFGATSVQVIDYPHRFNHSAQCNLAVRAARHPLLLMLSNDALLLSPDALALAADVAAIRWVATVGFRIVGSADAKGKLQSLGLAPSPRQWLLQGGSPLSAYKPPAAMLDRTQQTHGNTFAAAMLRREVYDELGGLDAQAFPTNYNDVDFCCRALQQGYRHVSIGAAVVEHVGRGSREMDLDLPIDQRILERCPPLAQLASIGVVAL
ncbi:DUF4214 domain-containing protein [Aquabacterium sp.]|uniref:DUF4214 domain-containing protein n=1 Tax=Aquabacterium sp. TaxID=1872578 RepID=UPI002CEF663E|nr:DUF4214 domain-containing protein [Aquabacterium sp.]HSW07419.1 DUF4214 domain-containing protein [Aquabacterium sp.]